jgi:hypothetical protein
LIFDIVNQERKRSKANKCRCCNLIFILSHRRTVIFKFFWGGTWSCEKIWEGVLYFCVLLHFYVTIFQSLLRGYMRCPPPPLVCIYVSSCF